MAVAKVEPQADLHRWSREEYHRMAAQRVFHPEARVELIEGIVYDMAPQNSLHSTGVSLAAEALRAAFPGSYIRIQMPLGLGEDSEPEPDVAVVQGSPRDYSQEHPSTALLVIEVADWSLLHDQRLKLPLYAAHGIPECWISNLRERVLEVYREPGEGGYQTRRVLRAGGVVSPLAQREAVIAVQDLMP
jgi:Uma2 family endonuclease